MKDAQMTQSETVIGFPATAIRWQLLMRSGLLAGLITVYTGAVGMIDIFSNRAVISGVLTLGEILIFAATLIAGYMVTRQANGATTPPIRLVRGLLVGFFSALPVLLLIGITLSPLDVRSMFVNLSPRLMNLLTFGQDPATGIPLLVGLFMLMGVIGAGFTLISPVWRRGLMVGMIWMLGAGMLSDLLVTTLRPLLGNNFIRTVFQSGALRPTSALVIFVSTALISFLIQWQRNNVSAFYQGLGAVQQTQTRHLGISLLAMILLVLPWILGVYLSEVMSTIGLFILMGLGLNIAVGLAGLLDLGYVSNFAIGAYIMAIFTSTGPLGLGQFSFWMILPVSVLTAMFTGFLLALPVLRMRGDYLAITTLGFGEIIRILALSDWLAPVIGGAQGLLFIPKPQIGPLVLAGPQQLYYLILAACLLTLFVSFRLNNSRIGRQWMALREDEDVAGAMGIDTMKTKLLAFTISAASGGLAGAIFAVKLGTIFPHSFNLLISVNTLSVILVGGMGSIPGIIVGALALIGLPELLREFAEFRLLIYGALLIVMMLLRPEGLWPSSVRRRELAAAEDKVEANL
jgi:branched-chain amino acid transport system permease protein